MLCSYFMPFLIQFWMLDGLLNDITASNFLKYFNAYVKSVLGLGDITRETDCDTMATSNN